MDITDKKTAEIGNLNVDDLSHLLQDVDHMLLMEVLIDKLETIGQERRDGYGERRWEAAKVMKEMLSDFDR
jgi:hypothetical protein